MKTKQFDLNKILNAAAYILFIAGFVFLCYVIRTRSWTWLDSDMSSELILAKMLNEEGRILTPHWYYGTELRILYYTQISAVLFSFTDNWYMIRVYSDIIMILILLASIWCLVYRLGIKKYFPTVALIMVLPFSMVYSEFVLYGAYYIPCIAISFFGMALILHFVQSTDRRVRIVLLLGAALLALVSSLIGYRQAVMFYLPVFLCTVLMLGLEMSREGKTYKEAKSVLFVQICLITLLSSGIGCVINSMILTKKYPVENWNYLSFKSFNFDRFIETISGMIRNLGYIEDKIGIDTLISNGYAVLAFAVCVFAVYVSVRKFKDQPRDLVFLSMYLGCAAIMLAMIYACSDMVYYDLYSIPITVFCIPVIILLLEQTDFKKETKQLCAILFSVIVCLVSRHNYDDLLNHDNTAQFREISAYAVDHGYETGYGTFWNANVLTELSNGRIDMYNWQDAKMLSEVKSVDDVHHWLQKVSHDTERPDGKVFHIYNKDELYYCNWSESLNSDDIIYETEDYIIYGYASYDDMKAKIVVNDTLKKDLE